MDQRNDVVKSGEVEFLYNAVSDKATGACDCDPQFKPLASFCAVERSSSASHGMSINLRRL